MRQFYCVSDESSTLTIATKTFRHEDKEIRRVSDKVRGQSPRMISFGTNLAVWVVGRLAADPPHDPDLIHLMLLTKCELETRAEVSLRIVNGDILEV